MTVEERIRISQLQQKMVNQKDYCKKLGLKDLSKFKNIGGIINENNK